MRTRKERHRKEPAGNAAVPLFGSWRRAYAAVAMAFVLDVAIFYAISRYFA